MSKPEWTRLPHIAKGQLGLDDTEYRDILSFGGVRSAKDIKSQTQFEAIMAAFRAAGFQSTANAQFRVTDGAGFWRCTPEQRRQIEVLWANLARTPTIEALRKFVARIIHIDHPSWISTAQAAKVILALRAMSVQAGLNPDDAQRVQLRPTVGKVLGKGMT